MDIIRTDLCPLHPDSAVRRNVAALPHGFVSEGSIEEFEMIGGEELLYSNGIAIVEWSEKIAGMLPDTTLFVDIDIMPNEDRVITLHGADL